MILFGGIFYAVFAEGTVQRWADEENKNDSDEKTSFKSWRKSKQTAFLSILLYKYLFYYFFHQILNLIHSEISKNKRNFDSATFSWRCRPLHSRTPWKRIGFGWIQPASESAFISTAANIKPPVFAVMKETKIRKILFLLFRQSKTFTNCQLTENVHFVLPNMATDFPIGFIYSG